MKTFDSSWYISQCMQCTCNVGFDFLFWLTVQDVLGHPCDVRLHIIRENDTCCLDDIKHVDTFAEYVRYVYYHKLVVLKTIHCVVYIVYDSGLFITPFLHWYYILANNKPTTCMSPKVINPYAYTITCIYPRQKLQLPNLIQMKDECTQNSYHGKISTVSGRFGNRTHEPCICSLAP